jgi:hypothetical protein
MPRMGSRAKTDDEYCNDTERSHRKGTSLPRAARLGLNAVSAPLFADLQTRKRQRVIEQHVSLGDWPLRLVLLPQMPQYFVAIVPWVEIVQPAGLDVQHCKLDQGVK